MESLLDHVFLTFKDLDRSITFYGAALKPLGIVHALDYDGKYGPEGHPDLKGFGRDGRVFFWLRHGDADPRAVHIGFVAKSEVEVNAFYKAAMAAGQAKRAGLAFIVIGRDAEFGSWPRSSAFLIGPSL